MIEKKYLKVSNYIDALDNNGIWGRAIITSKNKEMIKIHHIGTDDWWDEWIPINSDRLAKASFHTGIKNNKFLNSTGFSYIVISPDGGYMLLVSMAKYQIFLFTNIGKYITEIISPTRSEIFEFDSMQAVCWFPERKKTSAKQILVMVKNVIYFMDVNSTLLKVIPFPNGRTMTVTPNGNIFALSGKFDKYQLTKITLSKKYNIEKVVLNEIKILFDLQVEFDDSDPTTYVANYNWPFNTMEYIKPHKQLVFLVNNAIYLLALNGTILDKYTLPDNHSAHRIRLYANSIGDICIVDTLNNNLTMMYISESKIEHRLTITSKHHATFSIVGIDRKSNLFYRNDLSRCYNIRKIYPFYSRMAFMQCLSQKN